MSEKLKLSKRPGLKGVDGYKVFSIRIPERTAMQLDDLARKTNRSRNQLISIMLDFAIANVELEESAYKI